MPNIIIGYKPNIMERTLKAVCILLYLIIPTSTGLFLGCANSTSDNIPNSPPAMEGEHYVSQCEGINGSDLPCYWRYQYNDSVCGMGNPCNKLVIYFSGGGMVCDDGFQESTHYTHENLTQYVNDGYIGVCANIFLDKFQVPYLAEANRIDLIMQSIQSSPDIHHLWTGDELLFSGISHGATAPVLAMAKTDFDTEPDWKGNTKTAACFVDGVHDVQAANAYFLDYPIQCRAVRQSVICDRYFSGDCANFDASDANYLADTVGAVSQDNLEIKNWKLVECGSNLPGCLGDSDWIPADPIINLCNHINAGGNHTCEIDAIPEEGHLTCGRTAANLCRNWFNLL